MLTDILLVLENEINNVIYKDKMGTKRVQANDTLSRHPSTLFLNSIKVNAKIKNRRISPSAYINYLSKKLKVITIRITIPAKEYLRM